MLKKLLWLLALAAAAGGLYWWTTRPQPLEVETALAREGPLEVSLTEQGETRAHDRYQITAPVAGRLLRLELHAGDRVTRGQAVAVLQPTPLEPRLRLEAEAQAAAARAREREAAEQVARARAALDLAARELARAEKLFRSGDIPQQKVEQARSAETIARREADAALARQRAAAAEIDRAGAALLPAGREAAVTVRAPTGGRVLRVSEPSERILAPGEPLLTIGDSARLEVVADVLSTDAVKLRPGLPAWLEQWGGDRPLRAVVQTIEPLGFTKVSALGVEEKRVPVRLDFVDPPGPLGDGYRVDARIVLWSSPRTLQVPASAVFRCGDAWCLFRVDAGLALRHPVTLGHRNDEAVEITGGLRPDDRVVIHPPRELRDGQRVSFVLEK